MSYELQSYQNHPDYTRTLSCCSISPEKTFRLKNDIKNLLTTELIGLETLKKWIISNEFNLNATTKVMELKKTIVLREKIMEILEKK